MSPTRLMPDPEEAAAMLRALAHPIRIRLLQSLADGERCVSDLQRALDLPQAVVSQQLARMRAGGIVRCRRDGANMRYVVADERALGLLQCMLGSRAGTRTQRRRTA